MRSVTDEIWINRRLGEFEIIRELGRGGMGIVFEARQLSLNRRVALKVLNSGLGLTSNAVQRFRREAEAAAKLHHTNIVPVYATGEHEGIHFYAMEMIDGPSLDQVIKQIKRETRLDTKPATPPELTETTPYYPCSATSVSELSSSSLGSGTGYFDAVARMLADVAEALEHARVHGIIHRDMKPSNLLLSSSGRLSINDFGLARVLEQPGMTMTGEFVGTPIYMSPEQITAGRVPVDHRADVYSLGATLYELLTLEPPFTGERRDQVLAQILHTEPRAPRQLNKRIPADLETICLKAMDKDPERRYATAQELAEDLRRYVNRFAIAARRAGPVQRLVKWSRRQPAVAASLACLLLAACVTVAFAYRAHLTEQQRVAEQARARLALLDEKIRNAYQVASSGDLKQTDEAIKEIEDLGASTGQVRLLRGVVAYFGNDAAGAIGELDQAVKLLPESVAARALLAMSYCDYGQFERYEQLILDLERLAPSTPEDYLFRGYVRELNEPGLGLADLNEGIRRRDSPLGRSLRAIDRANRAIDSGQRHDAEEALADASAARGMLPNNPLVLYASLYARLVAAGIYQERKLPDLRKEVLDEAVRDVRGLESSIELPNPAYAMWLYFEEIGDRDKALDVGRRWLEKSKGPQAAFYCVSSLYRQGEYAEALNCLAQRHQVDMSGDLMRAFLLAELPDGPRQALDEYRIFADKYADQDWQPQWSGYLMLLLGKKEQAQECFREFRLPFAHSQEWKDFYTAMRQFGCGELSEDGYLAKAGLSRWKQVYAHHQIGLQRLASGDRAGARSHFQKAVATRTIWFYVWAWSQMFLSRLESDPKWPPWIQIVE
jgi:serine/threonine protein kinase